MVFVILITSFLNNVLILLGEIRFESLLYANGSENLDIICSNYDFDVLLDFHCKQRVIKLNLQTGK